MSDPVISLGDMSTVAIPKGETWRPLGVLVPSDGRTGFSGQFAISMPSTLTQRATVVEVQLVRLTPGAPENPTGQDDRAMTLDVDLATGKVLRVRKRQNWTYHHEGRTYSDEPIRLEARHNGPATLQLGWVWKAVLLRAEASR